MKCPCGTPIAPYNRTGKCGPCRAKERYHANPEKFRARARAWRAAHREKVAEDNRRRYLEHREEAIAAAVAWNRSHPERRHEIRVAERHRAALEALEASKGSIRTLPRIKALAALAEAKATQAKYGIERRAYL